MNEQSVLLPEQTQQGPTKLNRIRAAVRKHRVLQILPVAISHGLKAITSTLNAAAPNQSAAGVLPEWLQDQTTLNSWLFNLAMMGIVFEVAGLFDYLATRFNSKWSNTAGFTVFHQLFSVLLLVTNMFYFVNSATATVVCDVMGTNAEGKDKCDNLSNNAVFWITAIPFILALAQLFQGLTEFDRVRKYLAQRNHFEARESTTAADVYAALDLTEEEAKELLTNNASNLKVRQLLNAEVPPANNHSSKELTSYQLSNLPLQQDIFALAELKKIYVQILSENSKNKLVRISEHCPDGFESFAAFLQKDDQLLPMEVKNGLLKKIVDAIGNGISIGLNAIQTASLYWALVLQIEAWIATPEGKGFFGNPPGLYKILRDSVCALIGISFNIAHAKSEKLAAPIDHAEDIISAGLFGVGMWGGANPVALLPASVATPAVVSAVVACKYGFPASEEAEKAESSNDERQGVEVDVEKQLEKKKISSGWCPNFKFGRIEDNVAASLSVNNNDEEVAASDGCFQRFFARASN